MSTKTSIKRIALVAVSALGFGLLSVMPAKAVTETISATMQGPVRVSFTDGARDTVAAQTFKATTTGTLSDATTDAVLVVTQAPTSAATVSALCGGATAVTDSLGATGAKGADGAILGGDVTAAEFSCTLEVTTSPASGTYKGTLTLEDTAADADVVTISWSFTTTGKVATVNTDADSYSMPALAQTSANVFLASKVVTVTLKDSAGNTTQAATGDSITTSITSATNINTKVVANNTTSANLTFSDSDLNDGTHTFRVGSVTAVADSETVTLTPAGIMPAQGVSAKSVSVSTAAASAATNLGIALATPSSSTVVKSATGTPKSYNTDPSVTSFVFAVTGLEVGKGYRIYVVSDDAGAQTAKDDTDNATASTINNDGSTATELFGIVSSSGTVNVTVAGAIADTKFIKISANDADFTDAVDSVVTAAAPAYRVKITTPTVTPSMDKTGAALTVAGDVMDQYGNAVVGATVSVLGEPTTTDASPANLTASATSSSTGAWSATLSAATALTTKLELSATAVKTGLTVLASTNAAGNGGKLTVNLTASGSPTTLTYTTSVGDEGTATTPTTYPAIWVMYEGAFVQTNDITDQTYTISTGKLTGALTAGADFYNVLTPTTTPGAQVVITGTAGLKFATSDASASLSTLKDTVTVASGSAVYVFATTAGLHTVTMTSGATVKTSKIAAYENEAGARNIAAVSSTLTLKPSAFGTIEIKVTDAFGNIVKSGTSVSIAYTSTGAVNLEGPSTSKTTATTDANGIATIGVVAGGTAGTGTISVTATGDQFGALAGTIDPAATTAGTNTMSASTSTATITVTVEGSTAKTNDQVFAEATAAGTKADEAKAEAALATAAATTAGTKADAAATAATTAGDKADAAKAEAALATAAGKAAEAEAAKATAAATANAVEIAKLMAAITALTTSVSTGNSSASDAYEAAAEAIDAANAATDAANIAAEAADAATVAAEEARDAADAATAAVEELATQVSTLIASLKAQITTLGNTVAKIAKKVRA